MPETRCASWLRVACLAVFLVIFLGAALPGCGQKGPLYLPEETGPVVTRPAPASPDSQAPNTPETVDSPDGPANPAPEVTAPADDEDPKKDGAPAPR